MIYDKYSNIVFKNKWKNKSIFLLLTGPSLNNHDLSLLQNIWTFSIKSIPITHLVTTFWCGVESILKIPCEIWLNPTIYKFTTEEFFGKVFYKEKDRYLISKQQNIYWFKLRTEYSPQTFFNETWVDWGLEKNIIPGEMKKDEDGYYGRRSIMMAVIKIIWWLGFKRIYLLGCDFRMNQSQPYAYKREKSNIAVHENNELYKALNARFKRLKIPLLEQGIEIYNCNPSSKLEAFEFKDYNECLKDKNLYRN